MGFDVSDQSEHSQQENSWIEAAKTLGLSLILAFGIRQFIAEPRYIPSESMVPTLQINDRLMVEKLSYLVHEPNRGDVVVFWPPEALKQQNPELKKDAFIKRVIGVPGDKVQVKGGLVYVNDRPQTEPYIAAKPNYNWGPEIVPMGAYMVLGDNRNHSYDSHYWGYVPRKNIIGRAAFRFWPLPRLGAIDGIPQATPAIAPVPQPIPQPIPQSNPQP
jgi:signal peptidase I